jgi:hypothetical protein
MAVNAINGSPQVPNTQQQQPQPQQVPEKAKEAPVVKPQEQVQGGESTTGYINTVA